MSVYDAQARIKKIEDARAAKEAADAAALQAKAVKDAKDGAMADRFTLEAYKMTVISELSRFIPLMIMNEGFTRIMMGAMPHDDDYKSEHQAAIETVNRIWLHHLGGVKYLKEQSIRTGSSFLMNWYKNITEAANEILDDRIEAIQNANNEDEVNAIVRSGINGDQANRINRDIDSMGPDQIATAVQNKVLDVVKDESKRQSEDAAFRSELSSRAKEYEAQDNDKGDATIADADQPNDTTAAENPEVDQETSPETGNVDAEGDTPVVDQETENPKTEAAKLARYIINPVILHEHTLFYAMTNHIYHEMVNAVKECGDNCSGCPECDKDIAIVAAKPNTTPISPAKVMTSPLMMSSFDDFLNDYQDDMKHVDSLRVANKAAIAGDTTRIDSEDVLAEALTQYTLLETAMHIKLITPTAKEVREATYLYMKH